MGRYSLNVCLDNKTKMKIIIIACLLSCLLDSTFGAIQLLDCDGVTGTQTALQQFPGGPYTCTIDIGENSASGSHVCDRLDEIDDACDFFKKRRPVIGGFGGSFGGSFGGGGGQTQCVTTCKSNGSCQVKIVNGPPGKSSGSCFPQSFGGSCSGIPDKCTRGRKISTQCGSPCKAGTRNV